MRITRETVRLAYRLFLGREPENEQVVESALNYETLDNLRRAFLDSDEFKTNSILSSSLVPLTSPPLEIEWEPDRDGRQGMLEHVCRSWTKLGQERPYWSVLSEPGYSPEHTSISESDFYASGAHDLERLLSTLDRVGLEHSQFHSICEFGCGLGRVTEHLAKRFESVTSIDISPSHIDLAKAAVAKARNVRFILADTTSFGMTAPFDLWFSRIVLQHNPPPIIAAILDRMFDMLTPGGVAVFQVPVYAIGYRFRAAEYLRTIKDTSDIEMHALPQGAVFHIAARHGCMALEAFEDDSVGVPGWISTNFVFQRNRQP